MIDPTRTALLVMDYQAGILGSLDGADALVERANGALSAVRERGGSVGYVRVAFEEADLAAFPETSSMGARVAGMGDRLGAGAPASQIDERVAPREGDVVVRKVRVGAFSTTDLDAQLRTRGVDTLLLAGVSTSGVVLSTVRDAADRDYRVVVFADACADPQPDVHTFLVERIFPRQAEVVRVAELDGLLGRAS